MTTTAEETAVESPTIGDRVRVTSLHPDWSGLLEVGDEGTLTGGPSTCCSGNHRWQVHTDDDRTGNVTEVVKVTAPSPSDGTLRLGARVKVSDNPGFRGPGIGYVDPGFAGATGVIVGRGTVGSADGTWEVRRDGGPTERGVATNYIHPDCLTVIDAPEEPDAPETVSVVTAGMEQEISRLRERAERAERELEAFRDKVRTRVIEEADARGWCSEADDWLEDLGLEGRSRDFTVYVTASVTIPLAFSRTARNEDDAASLVDLLDVQRELNEHLGSVLVDYDLDDFEVGSVDAD